MECKPQYIKRIPPTFTDRTNSDQGGLLEYMLDHTWTPENPNPNAEYPRATFINDTNNYAESTLWEKDAKYLRLKNLQIAYNFNLPFMKKLKLNTMQLALSGYNLLTFTPYFGVIRNQRLAILPLIR